MLFVIWKTWSESLCEFTQRQSQVKFDIVEAWQSQLDIETVWSSTDTALASIEHTDIMRVMCVRSSRIDKYESHTEVAKINESQSHVVSRSLGSVVQSCMSIPERHPDWRCQQTVAFALWLCAGNLLVLFEQMWFSNRSFTASVSPVIVNYCQTIQSWHTQTTQFSPRGEALRGNRWLNHQHTKSHRLKRTQ